MHKMRASTSQQHLKPATQPLHQFKRDQNYAMNKNYDQFESTYAQEYKVHNEKHQQDIQRSLQHSQSQVGIAKNSLLSEYLQSKRPAHRNIKALTSQVVKRSKVLRDKGNIELQKDVIEKFFSSPTSPHFLNPEASPEILRVEPKYEQSVAQDQSNLNFYNRSSSEVNMLRSIFPKKHQYLADHIEHMQNCPNLVCICCSAKSGDHFVPFKYPQQIGTTYEKQFLTSNNQFTKSEQFVLDKEKRCFINGQQQSAQQFVTTQRNDFRQFKVKPVLDYNKTVNQGENKTPSKSQVTPFVSNSSYRTNFLNLAGPVYHEKNPVFPVYSLPFKSSTSYQKSIVTSSQAPLNRDELDHDRKMVQDLAKKQKKGNVLYQDMPFQSQTTNRMNFGSPKIYDKSQLCPPPVDLVTTFQIPDHFLTSQRKDFTSKLKPKCDIQDTKEKIMKGTITCPHSFKMHL